MALSADTDRTVRVLRSRTEQIEDAKVCYKGALGAILGPDHGTAADIGQVRPWTAGDNEILLGLIQGPAATGDDSATEPPTATFDELEGAPIVFLSVTGVTGIADTGKFVFATDDGTFTLTRPVVSANSYPVGMIWKHRSGTEAEVLLFTGRFSFLGQAVFAPRVQFLGRVDIPGRATGDLITSIPLFQHGTIHGLYLQTVEAPAGTGASSAINVEIGTTDVVGLSLTFATGGSGGSVGDVVSDLTAASSNRFHAADALSVEHTLTGTFSAGKFDLFMVYTPEIGT